mgnify:CR=1 FL=1
MLKSTLLVTIICLGAIPFAACSKKSADTSPSTVSTTTTGTTVTGTTLTGTTVTANPTAPPLASATPLPVDGTSVATLTQSVTSISSELAAFKNTILSSIFSIGQGGTGANNIPLARVNLGIGSVITRYGNDNLPSNAPYGSSLLFQGLAFSSYYSHSNKDIECVANALQYQDRGAAVPTSIAADVLYAAVTNVDGSYSPTDIPSGKQVSCAQIYVPAPTFVMKGSPNCPSGWSSIYSGWLMGGYYYYGGTAANSICVARGNDFSSQTGGPPPDSTYAPLMGMHTRVNPAPQGQPNNQWLPCAVCAKN